ncbi:MAG: SMP-30/gluconolactonase/LRE family protein [Methyloceanibacter sp.]|nr:SMP-30/gluconolactonase/LRE family protein [Methyloceanibacter sp.]
MSKVLSAWIAAVCLSLGPVLVPGAASAEPKLVWEADGFAGPESVVLDDGADVLYLSNVNGNPTEANGKGYISKLSRDGKTLEKEWVSGLNAPKGLGLHDGTLYAADINQVAEIDVKTGKVVKTHEAPGATFLNDVAVHEDGRVFISDMLDNQIWVLDDGKLTLWLDSTALDHPNGLLAEKGRLVVATWGVPKEDFSTDVPGSLRTVDIATKKIEKLGDEPIGNLDGIEPDGKGSYLVTDWFNGGLFRIAPDGGATKLLDLSKGSADLAVIDGGTVAIIPMMLDNKVLAYELQ